MRDVIRVGLMFWLFCCSSTTVCAEASSIYYYQNDERHPYQIELLEHVLRLTEKKFGTVKAVNKPVKTNRDGLWALRTGDIDVAWMASTKRNESYFLPVKIPIMQGMLGYRPLLTTTQGQEKFQYIRTLDDLKYKAVTAFGRYWDSMPILIANGLPSRTSAHYQELFEMVASGEVDYMPRGLSEIYRELQVQQMKFPNLVICTEVALYIPMVTYFHVHKDKTGLAARLQAGLQMAMKDGSFKKIFDKHFGESIEKAKQLQPRLITLKNPLLPDDIPTIQTEWWVPEHLKGQISNQPGAVVALP